MVKNSPTGGRDEDVRAHPTRSRRRARHGPRTGRALLRTLGTPELVRDNGDVVPLRGTVALVLARLVVANGDVVSVERLIEDVWQHGVGPGAVRTTVSRLRAALGEHGDAIVKSGVGYRFDQRILRTDLTEFVGTTSSPKPGCMDVAAVVDTALRRANGQLFDGLEAAFLDQERDRLLQVRLGTIERFAGGAQAPVADVHIDELARLADDHPEREALVVIAAGALARAGRRSAALRMCARHRKVAWENWGVIPGRALDDLEQALLREPSPSKTAAGDQRCDDRDSSAAYPTVVTPDGLVGRERDLVAIRRLVEARRIVSIVGFGGVGKTHLAWELARTGTQPFTFVDLSHARTEQTVESTIVEAFGVGHGELSVTPVTKICQAVDRPTLMALDNCEHVAGIVRGFVERLIARSPDISVLITSRIPVGVRGEVVYPLASLGTRSDAPEHSNLPSDALKMLSSLVTHVDWREQAELGETLVEAVGGLPLAVIFMARMLQSLSPAELGEAIAVDGPVAALGEVDGVAVEIRTIADRALERLEPRSRRLLVALSHVPGRFDLELAAAVQPDPEPVTSTADRLRTLAELGFIERHGGGLRMTALLRDYVAPLSDPTLERSSTCALWRYLSDVATIEGRRTRASDQHRALVTIEGHWPLFRELLTGPIPDEHFGEACVIAVGLAPFWSLTGRWCEGPVITRSLLDDPRVVCRGRRAFLVAGLAESTGTYAANSELVPLLVDAIDALERQGSTPENVDALATCHMYAARAALWLADGRALHRHIAAFDELARRHDLAHRAGTITLYRGLAQLGRNPSEMRRLAHRARSEYLRLGDRARAGLVMLTIGMVFVRLGELEAARSAFVDSLTLTELLPLTALEAHSRCQLAQLAAAQGLPDAMDDLLAARTAFVEMGDIGCLNGCNRSLAGVALSANDPDGALRWLRDTLDAVADVDQQEFAMTLLEIAVIYASRGRDHDASVICATARSCAGGTGIGLSEEQRRRMDDVCSALPDASADRDLAIALAMS